MSGPIVRRYGFPNFDKIFGERPLQHGVEEKDAATTEPEKAEAGRKAEPGKAPEQQRPAE